MIHRLTMQHFYSINSVYKILIFLIVGMTLSSCKQIDELTQFTMEYEQEVTIPSSTGLNLPFNIFAPETKTNAESEFEINDTRKDLVEEIVLQKAALNLRAPENSDFGFLKEIRVFISAEGLDEKEIAFKK